MKNEPRTITGNMKLGKYSFSFVFQYQTFKLHLVLNKLPKGTHPVHETLMFSQRLRGLLDKKLLQGITSKYETVIFFPKTIATGNLNAEFDIKHFVLLKNHNPSIDKSLFGLTFWGDLVDEFYPPMNAFNRETFEEKIVDGKVVNWRPKHELKNFDEDIKTFSLAHTWIDTITLDVSKGWSSADKIPYENYKSYFAINYKDKKLSLGDLNNLCNQVLDLFKFLFHTNEIGFRKCTFNAYITNFKAICYGEIFYNPDNVFHEKQREKVFDASAFDQYLPQLASLFLSQNIWFDYLSKGISKGYYPEHMMFMYANFEKYFRACYPKRIKALDKEYVTIRDKAIKKLEELIDESTGKEKKTFKSFSSFISKLDYFLSQNLDYAIEQLTPDFDKQNGRHKYVANMVDLRNALMHGKNVDTALEYKDFKRLDELIYLMIFKMANIDLDIARQLMTTSILRHR